MHLVPVMLTGQHPESQFATLTRGAGLMHRAFSQYRAYAGPLDRVRKGALVSMAGAIGCTVTGHCKCRSLTLRRHGHTATVACITSSRTQQLKCHSQCSLSHVRDRGLRPPADGTTTLHALGELQVRGTLFIGTHSATYNGMIIGESARESDMEARTLTRSWLCTRPPGWRCFALLCSGPHLRRSEQSNINVVSVSQVNPVREKKLTNIRTTAADEKVFLQPPRKMTLEDAIGASNTAQLSRFYGIVIDNLPKRQIAVQDMSAQTS